VVKAPLLVVLLVCTLPLALQMVLVSALVPLLGFVFGRSPHLGLALGLVRHLVFALRSVQQRVQALVLKLLQGKPQERALQ